jgi:hypothetical protein
MVGNGTDSKWRQVIMQWFVEKDIFPENEEKLSQVLGERLTFVRRQTLLTGIETLDGSPVEQTGIFYGSIQLARHLQRSGFLSLLPDNNFDCSYWMPYFGTLALNYAHLYIEAGCFASCVRTLGIDSVPFFVKQEKGYKHLNGHVYDNATCDLVRDILFPHELLLIAPISTFGREFRFVVDDNDNIITYSEYSLDCDYSEPVPDSAVEFVKKTMQAVNYYPSNIWTLDICEYPHKGSGQYRVVEPNSLLSSGWYNADVEKIVNAIDKIVSETPCSST